MHRVLPRRFGVGKLVTGPKLNCSNWGAEAALRMLHHNVHPDVAERSADLVVYGGTGKAARNQECWDAIALALLNLGADETLLVQSGKPVHVLRTMSGAPRVVIANSNLVGHWANWDHFRELEQRGLMMYGQMTAGSWIYIGTQGILQGTYETFAEALRQHCGGEGRGRLIVSGGLGGMGGAQPMAATMNGAVFLAADVDRTRIEKRLATQYLDEIAHNVEDAIDRALEAKRDGRAVSIGVVANQVELLKALLARNVIPDLLTDQTSAHDNLNGYVPHQWTYEYAMDRRQREPGEYKRAAMASMAEHCRLMVQLQEMGAHVFDYGNNLRGQALAGGYTQAFKFPGFVPAYIRPLFCQGKGPFRWVALSGDPEDILATDRAILRLFPRDKALARWIQLAGERVKFQGLPSRICWLGLGDRVRAGLEFNRMVARGELSAPVIIGRDHLDCGSVASPNRETEAMKDGTDAVADWVFLNAIMNAIGGATWVSVHEGGGVGIGYSQHAGMVILCDGSRSQAEALKRVLHYDPASGVARHADAGYEDAIAVARAGRLKIPMLPKPARRGR